MKYNPEIHHRRSVRLKGYDYSREGLYFITICLQERECLFGASDFNRAITLNEAGKMAVRWYEELEKKYPDKIGHEMIVMPNHVHFIIENMQCESGAHVGAPLRGRPIINPARPIVNPVCPPINPSVPPYGPQNQQFHAPIGNLVLWYKTMTTNEYIRGVKQHGWKPFNGRLWQRNYYEHIIRSMEEHERIANYIHENPERWKEDKFYRR